MTDPEIMHPDETPFGKEHVRRMALKKARCIKVPYFGTEKKPLLLFAYPLTTGQVMELEGKYPTNTEQNVMQMIMQCRDSSGELYFSLIDKTALMNEPSEIIGKICVELNGDVESFEQELKKNNE